MQNHFIAYYEHIAKLAQVANKQTMFLAYILYYMEFDKETKQYHVDLSTARKIEIMKKITPNNEDKGSLNRANQYINKLKKVGFIHSAGRGVWIVNPMCYGAYKPVTKSLREENAKISTTVVFDKNGLRYTETAIDSPTKGKIDLHY